MAGGWMMETTCGSHFLVGFIIGGLVIGFVAYRFAEKLVEWKKR